MSSSLLEQKYLWLMELQESLAQWWDHLLRTGFLQCPSRTASNNHWSYSDLQWTSPPGYLQMESGPHSNSHRPNCSGYQKGYLSSPERNSGRHHPKREMRYLVHCSVEQQPCCRQKPCIPQSCERDELCQSLSLMSQPMCSSFQKNLNR